MWVGTLDNTGATRVNIIGGSVSGSVSVSNFPASQTVNDGGGSLTVDGAVSVSNFPAVQTVSGAVSVSNFPPVQPIDDNGGSLTVDGAVAVSNFPTVQPVNDNGGSLTVDGSVSVSNFPAIQPVSGSVSVSNFPAVQPVSDNGGSLTIDGTIAVSNFPALQRVQFSGDSSVIDPAQRIRISTPVPLFFIQQTYDNNPLSLEAFNTGTGVAPSFDSNTRVSSITVNAGTGTSGFQSFQKTPYQPGKGVIILISANMGTGVANVTKDIGYFSSNNGLFFRQNGTSGLQVGVRTNTSGVPVDTLISRAAWNVDKFDGTGPSTLTLDETKIQLFVIDFLYLGSGRVRFGFNIGGITFYAHYIQTANVGTLPFIQHATLPFQALVTSTVSVAAATLTFKCVSIDSEGQYSILPRSIFSTPQTATVAVANGARTHIISIRPKTIFKGLSNIAALFVTELNISNNGTATCFYEVVLGANFSVAPTWADVDTNYSASEYATGGTYNNLTNGYVIASGYVASLGTQKETKEIKLPLPYNITLDRSGAVRSLGTLTILGTGNGVGATINASLEISEIY